MKASEVAAARSLGPYRALALLAWRYWRRRPLALGGALLKVGFATGLASAGLVAHKVVGGAYLAVGAAAIMVALLAYAGWVRARSEERADGLRLLSALGLPGITLRWASRLEVALLTALGAVPGAALGARVAAVYLVQVEPAALSGPFAPSSFGDVDYALVLLAAGVAALLLAWALEHALSALSAALKRALGLPVWLRVAAGQLTRGRRRAGATMAALAVTVAAVVGLRGADGAAQRSLTAWLDDSVTWDVQVAGGHYLGRATTGLTRAALTELSFIPGVADVSPERRAVVGSRGRNVPLVALDRGTDTTRRRLKVVEGAGSEPGAVALSEGDVVALSVPLARRLSVGVGDSLPLTTSTGERAFRVVALVDDRAGVEAAYLDLVAYAGAFDDHAIDTINVRLSEGADAASVALTLQGDYTRVATAGQYRNAVLGAASTSYAAALYLAFGALALAFLGLVVAAATAALRAHDERLLFSALGAPEWALRRGVALEVGFGVVVALVFGVLVGTLLVGYLSGGQLPAPLFGALN